MISPAPASEAPSCGVPSMRYTCCTVSLCPVRGFTITSRVLDRAGEGRGKREAAHEVSRRWLRNASR